MPGCDPDCATSRTVRNCNGTDVCAADGTCTERVIEPEPSPEPVSEAQAEAAEVQVEVSEPTKAPDDGCQAGRATWLGAGLLLLVMLRHRSATRARTS